MISKQSHSAIVRILLSLMSFAILGYFIKIGFNIALARTIKPSQYGDFIVSLQLLNTLAVIALLGSKTSLSKFVSVYLENKDIIFLKRYAWWNLKVLMITILSIVAILLLINAGVYLGWSLSLFSRNPILIKVLWLLPLMQVNLLITSVLLANKSYLTQSILTLFGLQTLLLCYLLGFISMRNHVIRNDDLFWILLLALISSIFISALVTWFLVQKKLNTAKKTEHLMKDTNEQDWWVFSLKATAGDGVIYLFAICDLLIIDIFLSPEMAGYYAAIISIIGFIWLVQSEMSRYLFANISGLVNHRSFSSLQDLISKSLFVNMITVTVLGITILFFAKPLLGIFGEDYTAHLSTLSVLVFTAWLGVLYTPLNNILLMSGYETTVLIVKSIAVFLLIIMTIPLTIYYGILGTAVGTLISAIGLTITYYIACKKALPVKVFHWF